MIVATDTERALISIVLTAEFIGAVVIASLFLLGTLTSGEPIGVLVSAMVVVWFAVFGGIAFARSLADAVFGSESR